MKPINIEEVIKAVGGVINKNIDTSKIFFKSISTDTRNIQPESLFIPLLGENFDAHDFLEEAFEKGAICALTQKDIETENALIKVYDTKKALADLANYYKNLFDIKVVAVTGSSGKTTTKDMIASVLEQKYKIVKTQGNLNNEIGLPMTIFNVEPGTEILILEMGMNNFNEIHNLSEIAEPHIAIITNIGFAHIENLGSREGILRAKCEIFDFLNENGIKILNADDDMLRALKDAQSAQNKFYSIYNKEDAYATNILELGLDGTKADVNIFDKKLSFKLKYPGLHMVSNSLCAALVGHFLGLSSEQIKKGIESFSLSKMRMDVIKTEKYTVINDVYNANPSSMKSSIDVLSNAVGEKVAILGDMLELGSYAPKFHYEIGQYAAKKDIDKIICIGELAESIYDGAEFEINNTKSSAKAYKFRNQEDFLKIYDDILNTGDNILVKASRSMKLEKTVDKLMR